MKTCSLLASVAALCFACRPQPAAVTQREAAPSAPKLGQVRASSQLVAASSGVPGPAPGTKFDLGHWKLTLPVDENENGKVDQVAVQALQTYQHADFFYLSAGGQMVFVSPNKGYTTPNSRNSRSELRQMLLAADPNAKARAPANNWALASHSRAEMFGAIGGRMEASLKVTHVPRRSDKPERRGAYAVVVGQIHAGKDKSQRARDLGFGWGNEPLKIFYRKQPHHSSGVVFWTYELNLEKGNPKRRDIAYPVWGGDWQSPADPGPAGVKLGETFDYVVNVYGNVLQVTFTAPGKTEVTYTLDLSNNIDAYGQVNADDHPRGYTGDFHYFKAGVYNQCNTDSNGCAGTGDWAADKQTGDYAAVAFSRLVLKAPVAP